MNQDIVNKSRHRSRLATPDPAFSDPDTDGHGRRQADRRAMVVANSVTVSAMISATGRTDSIRPAT